MTRQKRESFLSHLVNPWTFLAFFAGGVLTTLTGPFGTYLSMPLMERAVYWFGLMGLSLALGLTIRWMVEKRWGHLGFWVTSTIASLIFSVLFTGVVFTINFMMMGQAVKDVLTPFSTFLVIIAVPVTLNPIIYLYRKGQERAHAHQEQIETAEKLAHAEPALVAPRLAQRLPEKLGFRIQRVSVEDHYVHVYTSEGSERILLRFADALAELEGANGLQVHRSHWISPEVVIGHRTEGSRTLLLLKDGSTVPVSRGHRAAAQAAGLLVKAEGASGDGSGVPKLAGVRP